MGAAADRVEGRRGKAGTIGRVDEAVEETRSAWQNFCFKSQEHGLFIPWQTPPHQQEVDDVIRTAPGPRSITLCAGIALALILCESRARAEISLTDPARTGGWEVTTSGRVDSYLSWIFGNTVNRNGSGAPIDPAMPNGDHYFLVGPQVGIQGYPVPNGPIGDPVNDTKVNTARVRGGFSSTILAFNIYKQISPNLKLTFKMGLWAGIQNGIVKDARQQNDVAAVDWREQYMKLEGPWGALWAGRLLGLFNRGGMRLNWYLMHKQGVGHPCNVDSSGTTSCGNTGVGSLHPNRNGQLAYSTPEIAGVQWTVAMLDPSMIPGNLSSNAQWIRTPLPRFETEATFHRGTTGADEVNLFANGMTQVIGMSTEIPAVPENPNDKVHYNLPLLPADATRVVFGYGGGGWARTHGLAAGATYWAGKGLGTANAFGNTAVDNRGTLRFHFGYLAVVNYRLGDFEIASSYGSSNVKLTDFDRAPPTSQDLFSVVTEVRGIAGLIAYHMGPVTFSIDGMNIHTAWSHNEVLVTNVVSGGVLGEW